MQRNQPYHLAMCWAQNCAYVRFGRMSMRRTFFVVMQRDYVSHCNGARLIVPRSKLRTRACTFDRASVRKAEFVPTHRNRCELLAQCFEKNPKLYGQVRVFERVSVRKRLSVYYSATVTRLPRYYARARIFEGTGV